MDIRSDPRLAGRLKRYHTWPHIKEQSVGEHSWQIARILLTIAPKEDLLVLLHYAIVHDMGEIAVGDIPYPVKSQNPELKKITDTLEDRKQNDFEKQWMMHPLPLISERQKKIFKVAEYIEMMEWGLEELAMGNQYARLVATRCEEAALTLIDTLPRDGTPEQCRLFIARRMEHARAYS